jgi:hypothetical protein
MVILAAVLAGLITPLVIDDRPLEEVVEQPK